MLIRFVNKDLIFPTLLFSFLFSGEDTLCNGSSPGCSPYCQDVFIYVQALKVPPEFVLMAKYFAPQTLLPDLKMITKFVILGSNLSWQFLTSPCLHAVPAPQRSFTKTLSRTGLHKRIILDLCKIVTKLHIATCAD